MSREGLRIAVAGAGGALGTEVISVMQERRLPVAELYPFGTERSTGCEVEYGGESIFIEAAPPRLEGLDLLLVCTPSGPALELVRSALRAGVFCIDCSGSLAGSDEVPMLVYGLCDMAAGVGAPVVSTPAGPALAWSLALSALGRASALRRVVGTVLQSASCAGKSGIEALSGETLALLGQREAPEPAVFPGLVAFDCIPRAGSAQECGAPEGAPEGATAVESALCRDLARLLAPFGAGQVAPALSLSAVQVPTFVGDGSAIHVETERPLSAAEAREAIAKAPGLSLWTEDGVGPTTRDTAGRDVALVGRVRTDPAVSGGLALWVAADSLRLAAANAVRLAETRLT